jgi:xanthine dehydrogenase accessory factor
MDVHAVIETKRGHELGKVIYTGQAAEDTKEPGKIEGYGRERLLRAPEAGIFKPHKQVGDLVKKGEHVASVGGSKICAQIDGLIRGMLYEGLEVIEGTKVGDIDPRGASVNYETISDKARAIGGGVLEAILHRYNFPVN